MAEKVKKIIKPVKVTVVFEATSIEFEDVIKIEENDDGRITLHQEDDYVTVNSSYLYYHVEF